LSQSTRLTDGQTDGRIELSSLDRVCIPCSAVKMKNIGLFAYMTFIRQRTDSKKKTLTNEKSRNEERRVS